MTMPLSLDPEVLPVLQKLAAAMAGVKPPPVGDWKSRRQTAAAMFTAWAGLQPLPGDVSTRDFTTPGHDGAAVALRWFEKSGAKEGSPGRGPAALFIHGGGMILGDVGLYDAIVKRYVSQSGVPLLAVEYRLAPEHPHPTPVEDCYAGLRWLADHAPELGVDPARIAVMGDSAGGGLAAATALVARDRGGPALAKQILIYPMLDDRNTTPIPELLPFATWSWDDNVTGWGALLGAAAGKEGVSHHAAPARAADLSRLPPTYIDVGQLDIFCDEDIAYALRLVQAQVPTELHVHPGVPHGFEVMAPEAGVSRRATADRVRVLRSF
jgi:acetyl esterase/lipase